jgi:MFS transporter, DHA3 family, macrolide efflux protein
MIETDSATPTTLAHWKPRFFTIWTGQALSLIGSALTQFVLLWWITQTTNSVSALSFAALMGLLPTAIFSPFGGALADRWSRRTIMIVADAITAACMVILILLFAADRIELWHVYLLMFVRATMQSFQQPAAMASTANLVPGDWLARVGGMNQSLQGIMTVVAAPLGALALAFLPLEGALMIDVVTALLGIVPLLFYRIPQPRAPAHAPQHSLLAEIREGARYVAHRRSWLMLFGVSGLVVLTVMPTFALTPLLVKQHFGGGVNEVALMEAMAGVGIILGGLLVVVWTIPARRIVTVMVSFAISCGAVALTAMAPSNMLLLAVFWWFVSGVTYSTGNAPMMAIVQINIPNVLQGRVISLLNMVYGLAGPIGLALAAPLGELVGVQNLYIIGGTLSALVCLAGLCSPALRNIERV